MLYLCIIVLIFTLICDIISCHGQHTARRHYKVLGVSTGAGPKDIKRAYRSLAMKYHPDKNDSPEAKARFFKIKEARDALLHPERNAGRPVTLEDRDDYIDVIFNYVDTLKDVFYDHLNYISTNILSRLQFHDEATEPKQNSGTKYSPFYFNLENFFDDNESFDEEQDQTVG